MVKVGMEGWHRFLPTHFVGYLGFNADSMQSGSESRCFC